MKIKIHGGKRNYKIGVVCTEERIVFQEALFLHIAALRTHVFIGSKKETRRTTTRVRDGLGDFRVNHIHNGRNQSSGSEILTGTTLLILTVFLQNFLIDCALEITLHHVPIIVGNHIDNLF